MQVLCGVLIIMAILAAAFAGIAYVVREEVDAVCANAQQEHPGDKVEALISYLSSESLGFKERNRIVWTLGELRDKRALPVLEPLLENKLYDFREVRKAVEKINGDIPNPYFWK
jgi:HEAT repeat protein